mmetsp:Transcript_33338/g.78596  ORF Transcript_33338/g.78596 Transcript_33338/m.78596 type:complete len:475 (+) Transcript_33338:165-1589(+)
MHGRVHERLRLLHARLLHIGEVGHRLAHAVDRLRRLALDLLHRRRGQVHQRHLLGVVLRELDRVVLEVVDDLVRVVDEVRHVLALEVQLRGHEGPHDEAGEEVFERPAVHVPRTARLHADAGLPCREDREHHPPDVRRVLRVNLADEEADPAEEEGGHAEGVEPAEGPEELHVGLVHRHVRREEGDEDRLDALADRGPAHARLESLSPVEEAGVEARHPVDVVLHAVPLERAPQRRAHEADHERVREARADGDRAQPAERLVLPAHEQRARARALGDGPVHALHDRGVEHATGRERVVHVGARVGRGDEVEHEAHEDQDLEELGHVLAVRLHHVEDGVVEPAARQSAVPDLLQRDRLRGHRLQVLVAELDAVGVAAGEGGRVEGKLNGALHLDAQAAEDGEEEEAVEHGGHHGADEHLADSAPAGDARHEHADEGRPRDPPAPVEDGPPVQEALGRGPVELRGRRELLRLARDR